MCRHGSSNSILPPPTPVGSSRKLNAAHPSLPFCLSGGSDDDASQYISDSGQYCSNDFKRSSAPKRNSGTLVHCDIQPISYSRDSEQSQQSWAPMQSSWDQYNSTGRLPGSRRVATAKQEGDSNCNLLQANAQTPSSATMIDISRLPPAPGSLRHASIQNQDLTPVSTPRAEVNFSNTASIASMPLGAGVIAGHAIGVAPNHGFGQTNAVAQSAGVTPTQADLESSCARLLTENQKLREWGDGLAKQVARMEQAAGDATGLISLYERRLEDSAKAGAENDNLRKQLAAYAVEVDSAREERGKLESSHCKGQEAMRHCIVERDDSRSRIGELEQELETLQKHHRELQERLQNSCDERGSLEANLREAEDRGERSASEARLKALSSVSNDSVGPIVEMFNALQEGFVEQTREFNNFIARVKEQRQDTEEQLLAEKNGVHGLEEKVAEAKSELNCLQEELDHCELQWQQRFQVELKQALLQAESRALQQEQHYESEITSLKHQLELESSVASASSKELSRRDSMFQEKNVKRRRRLDRDPALARLEKALSRNISRDMYRLHQGVVLEKVHERNCRRESRLFIVSGDDMMLRWGKGLVRLGRRHSCLDLYEVIRIQYGNMSRACVVHSDVEPWLCFSLYTPRRSFDFCCHSEETVQACVLGLSRLCDWASGAVRTHGQFLSLKGWCKLEEYCFRSRISLGQLFREAVEKTAAQLGLLADYPEMAADARRHDRGWLQRRPEAPMTPDTGLFSD